MINLPLPATTCTHLAPTIGDEVTIARNFDDFCEELAREFKRYEEHRRKWRGTLAGNRRNSKARMHTEKIAARFGISDHGHRALDYLKGYLILGSMYKVECYLTFTRETVRKYLEAAGTMQAIYQDEPGAENLPQLVIPGAEQISVKSLVERRMQQPLRPKAQQRAPSGLFSDARDQLALF